MSLSHFGMGNVKLSSMLGGELKVQSDGIDYLVALIDYIYGPEKHMDRLYQTAKSTQRKFKESLVIFQQTTGKKFQVDDDYFNRLYTLARLRLQFDYKVKNNEAESLIPLKNPWKREDLLRESVAYLYDAYEEHNQELEKEPIHYEKDMEWQGVRRFTDEWKSMQIHALSVYPTSTSIDVDGLIEILKSTFVDFGGSVLMESLTCLMFEVLRTCYTNDLIKKLGFNESVYEWLASFKDLCAKHIFYVESKTLEERAAALQVAYEKAKAMLEKDIFTDINQMFLETLLNALPEKCPWSFQELLEAVRVEDILQKLPSFDN